MKAYDLAIIGAGPGGYVAAIRAAQAGASVCLIEQERVGGTCLNHGCIPTKALYASARLLRQLRGAAEHGIATGGVSFDLAQAMLRKAAVVEKLVGGVEQLLKGNGVDLIRGRATLAAPGQVRVAIPAGVGQLRARKIILATGARAAVPTLLPVDGKNILTSREILAMKELPSSLAVVGGGYIGCELAGIFATFGSRVTIVEQLPQLLGRSDRQVVREVEKNFKAAGVEVRTGIGITAAEIVPGGVVLRIADGTRLTVEKVLVAAGRLPNSEDLGLETAGVQVNRGAVAVDTAMRTSVADIYAIGDLTGIIQLAHVASYQAEIAVNNALGGDARADYRVVPSAIFTVPEIGQVGLTEEECKAQGLAIEIGRFAYQASSKALCDGEPQGSIKLLAARDDDRILGAAVAGAEGATLIAEVAAAMAAGMTAKALGAVIHAHPTLPELVKEAAEDVHGAAVHKVGRKRAKDA
jgi:dihydrolipoamide dehydrogenase